MSKVSREQAQQNRERVVATAARLFRERGFDGIGIAELMKNADLTHGGFYAQFPSKEHLMAEACSRASDDLDNMWRGLLERAPNAGLSEMAAEYLSKKHRDEPGMGCFVTTLGAEAAHQGPMVRSQFTIGVKRFTELLMELIPGRSKKTKRREAIASFSAMVGAMVLARGVNDEALSAEILEAVRAHIADAAKALSA
jgi:TetR/AcrR family transcriptional regulator, transcriptional repressor for nem operon